jgi:hypothetical protein
MIASENSKRLCSVNFWAANQVAEFKQAIPFYSSMGEELESMVLKGEHFWFPLFRRLYICQYKNNIVHRNVK